VAELNASGTRHIHALQWSMKANQQAKQLARSAAPGAHAGQAQGAASGAVVAPARTGLRRAAVAKAHDAESILRVWADRAGRDRIKPYIAARAATPSTRAACTTKRAPPKKPWRPTGTTAWCAPTATAPAGRFASLLAQIEHCEAWLRERPTDAELALTLGALCLRQKLWGKAQRYLEQACRMRPSRAWCAKPT
jgi:HemY protein